MENRKNPSAIESKLVDILSKNHLDQALEIIHSGVDINTLIEFQLKHYKPVYQSLLHIMIVLMNVNSAQFLLEQGANPNILNAKGQSTLEVLLTEMCVKVVKHAYNKGPVLSEADIIQSEKMADLLLCFGLNVNKIIWTEYFLKYTNEVKDDLDAFANERLQHYKFITAICIMTEMPNYKKKFWVSERFNSLKRKKDIQRLETDYKKNQIDEECINPTLSLPFVSIILEYADTMLDISISIRAAKARVEKGAKTNFWLKTSRNLFDCELYKNILIYAATIKSVLPTFDNSAFRPDTLCLNDLLEIIAEYTLDDTTHDAKKNISTKLKLI